MAAPDTGDHQDSSTSTNDTGVEREFTALLATHADPERLISRVKMRAMNAATDEVLDAPLAVFEPFDFDAPEEEPDFVIDRLIERRTVNVCSGDTGAAKSIHWQDATVALLHGREWLNRAVAKGCRVLYVDEENPGRVVSSRLRALGMSNADRDRLRYYRRQGVQLGDTDGKWAAWLDEQVEAFRPDLVVIDTAMAATAVEANDNREVVTFYTQVLRPLAERYGLAVVILHHERKPGAQEKRNAGFAMMGARQWAGQADVHMTLTATSDYTETPRDAGGFDTHKAFQFSVAKGRDGHSSRPERTIVHGVKDDGYRLLSMELEWAGRVESDTAEDAMSDRIGRIMGAEPERKWTRAAVAEAAGEAKPLAPSGTFKRAWAELAKAGRVEAEGKAVKLTDEGREWAAGLGMEFA